MPQHNGWGNFCPEEHPARKSGFRSVRPGWAGLPLSPFTSHISRPILRYKTTTVLCSGEMPWGRSLSDREPGPLADPVLEVSGLNELPLHLGARSETVLSFPCGHQVWGRKHELASGPEEKQVGEIPVVTGWPRCQSSTLSRCGRPLGKPLGCPPSICQVTIILIIRHSSQHFPCINPDHLQAHFTDGETEAENAKQLA